MFAKDRAPVYVVHSSSPRSSRCRSFISSPTPAASRFNGLHPQLAFPHGSRFQADCASSTWIRKNEVEELIILETGLGTEH